MGHAGFSQKLRATTKEDYEFFLGPLNGSESSSLGVKMLTSQEEMKWRVSTQK